MYAQALDVDGTRITANLDFAAGPVISSA
jgi:hypothetical protein